MRHLSVIYEHCMIFIIIIIEIPYDKTYDNILLLGMCELSKLYSKKLELRHQFQEI